MRNFCSKNISHFKSQEASKNVAIFESKFDYAAASQYRDFSKIDVIVANSTSSHLKVAEALNAGRYESIEFYQQNDKPGIEFVKNVVQNAKIEKFEYIKYKKSEAGQDINDLHKNGVNIEERKIQNRQQEQEVEKESFVENLLAKLEHANDLIEIAAEAKAIDRDNFIGSLTKIGELDTKETLVTMNNTFFNDVRDSIKFVQSVAKVAIEVIRNGDLTLNGVTKAIIHEMQEQKLEKQYESEI